MAYRRQSQFYIQDILRYYEQSVMEASRQATVSNPGCHALHHIMLMSQQQQQLSVLVPAAVRCQGHATGLVYKQNNSATSASVMLLLLFSDFYASVRL